MELDRFEWLALRCEEAVDPDRVIVDAHHHLWDRGGSTYLAPQLLDDMTGTHNVVKSVFVDCRASYDSEREPHMRPVGETVFVAGEADAADALGGPVIAGIVSHADMRLGRGPAERPGDADGRHPRCLRRRAVEAGGGRRGPGVFGERGILGQRSGPGAVHGHRGPGARVARSAGGGVLGSARLVAAYESIDDLRAVLEALPGQLTATIHMTEADHEAAAELVPLLERKAGRLIANGWPTGVEVNHAMVHGGPFPATSDPRSTSVGTLAIRRFQRPVCYQNFPPALLPEAVRDGNPLSLPRRINGDPQL